VHALLNRTMPAGLAHISSLKQLVTLKLEAAPRKAVGAGAVGSSASDWQCPITGLEMNGRARFVVHRPTGHAISERALKEAPAAVEELLGGKWAAGDLIQVNPAGDELQKVKEQLAEKMAAERQKKLAKKLAKKAAAGGGEAGAAAEDEEAAGAGRSESPGSNGAGAAAGAVAGTKRPAQDAAAGNGSGGGSSAAGAPAAAAAAAVAAGPGKPDDGKPASKKRKVPDNATAAIYNSIFHTAEQAAAVKETYSCRSVSGRWRC